MDGGENAVKPSTTNFAVQLDGGENGVKFKHNMDNPFAVYIVRHFDAGQNAVKHRTPFRSSIGRCYWLVKSLSGGKMWQNPAKPRYPIRR